MMNDDDKVFEKTMTRIMIGGGILASTLIIAGAYDVGYQAGVRQTKPQVTVHGNVTINNNSNNQNSSQPTHLDK